MMFREKSISKFYAFALAAIFALTLAGCGGSGGGSAMMEEEMPPVVVEPVDPEPTPEEIAAQEEADALMAAQEGAMAAYMAAMAAAAGAVDPAAYAAAHAAAADAKTASDAAAAATTSAMAMEYQTAAEAAQMKAEEEKGERGLGITKTANAVANQSAIDSATAVGARVPAPYNNAARVGEAIRSLAINEDVDFTAETAAGTPGGATTLHSDIPKDTDDALTERITLTTRHTGSSPRFTVTVDEDADTTTDNRILARGEDPSSIMMRGGWMGTELVGETDDGMAKEYAMVFTDIKAPQQEYDSTAATDGTDNAKHYTLVELAGDPNDADDTGVLDRAVITGDIPGDGSHFAATFNPNPTDNVPPLSGRFHCATAPCSISVNDEGILVAIQGYQFRPAIAGDITRQDSDYLSWGVWLRIPKRVPTTHAADADDAAIATAAAAADIAAIAYGSRVFEVKAALTGSATYNGVAAGLYTAAGMVEYFDADVTLEANFGGKGAEDSTRLTPENDERLIGTVGGSVTNIRAAGMDVEGSIQLGTAQLLAPGDDDANTPEVDRAFTAATTGTLGGRGVRGDWGGRFYGPNHTAAGSVAERTHFPTTAAGTFSAGVPRSNTPHVGLVGAFGAWKAE